jgi:hypothetical protein
LAWLWLIAGESICSPRIHCERDVKYRAMPPRVDETIPETMYEAQGQSQ